MPQRHDSRFHEDDRVVLKAPHAGTNRMYRSAHMHRLPAGTKGIVNASARGVTEVEFRVPDRSTGFEDAVIMRVPDEKLDFDREC